MNYGRLGNNLPSPAAVISLLKSRKINHIRLFSPDKDVLNCLRGSGVKVVLGVRNQDIRRIGNDPAYARTWIKTNIVAFKNVQFRYISVGNEVDIPRSPASAHILPAMQNLNSALKAIGIKFPVSTTIATSLVVNSYPPSNGRFSDGSVNIMRSIVGFLVANRSPLLVNVYPLPTMKTDKQLNWIMLFSQRIELLLQMVVRTTEICLMP